MAAIADVFLRALLEDKQLQIDAAKSGDQAGATMGSRLSKGISVALRAGLGVVSAGAALATKGLLELEEVTADFAAETGATAEEAERAGKAINEMSGRNIQPMREIGAALTKVHTDLGLTGEQAEETTEKFLKFARATKQDAGSAVVAFDDILDNWGLTAADAQGLMDKLIVSHQKYGGAIDKNQTTLAKLAPALRAANFEIDDGIALLGLFGSKGLDADQATAAFAKALTKVKSPEELQALIADIAATEDPFERASKAADLFGARAGAKLANALGGVDLDSYKIDMEEAAGATEEAADVLDSTFGARAQLLIKGFTSKLIELGGSFGPVVTGLASLASLGGSLGLGRFLKLPPGVAAKSGAAIGKAFSAAFALAMKLGDAIAVALNALPGSSVVKSATSKIGSMLGGSLGTALKLGLLAAAAGIILELWGDLQKQMAEREGQFKAIGSAIGEQIATGTREQLEQSKAALEQGIADIGLTDFLVGGPGGSSPAQKLQAELDRVNAAIAALPPEIASTLEAGAPTVEAGAEEMSSGITDAVGAAVRAAADAARDVPGAIADGIRSDRDAIKSAMEQLREDLKNALNPAKEEARLIGMLTGKALKRGLESNDPLVVAQAEHTRGLIEDRLAQLIVAGGPLGKKAMRELRDGLRSEDPNIRAQAQRTKQIVEERIGSIGLYGEGRDAGQQFAAGLRATVRVVARAAAALASIVAQYLEFGSPTELGPFSEKGGPEGWARIGAKDWASGWTQVDPRPAVRGLAASAAAALSAPLTATFAATGAMAAAGGASLAGSSSLVVNGGIHLHGVGSDVSPAAARSFGQAVLDEVASGFRSQTARLPTGPRS